MPTKEEMEAVADVQAQHQDAPTVAPSFEAPENADDYYTDDEKAVMAGEHDIQGGDTPQPEQREPEDPTEGRDTPKEGQPETPPEAEFSDHRERKETYTPEEYGNVVKQGDYWRHRATEIERNQKRVDARLAEINEAITARDAPKPEPIPDANENPAGYLAHQNQEIRDELADMRKLIESRDQREERQTAEQSFIRKAEIAESTYAESQGITIPEFRARLTAIRAAKIGDLLAEGHSDQEAIALSVKWESERIDAAFDRNTNPAEWFDSEFKRRRLDPIYQKGQVPGNPAVEDPASPPVHRPTRRERPQDVIERAKRGTQVPRRTAGAGGNAGIKLNTATLAAMRPEEFKKVINAIKGTTYEDELDMGQTVTLPPDMLT